MDSRYKALISSYTKQDAVTAIVYWGGVMVLGALASYFGGYISSAIVLLLVVVSVVIVLVKKQGLSSIGLSGGRIGSSLIVGLLLSIVPLLTNHALLPALVYGWEPQPIGNILYQLGYYLFIVGLFEEIIFRGYIQTRLYGLFRSNTVAIIFGALMFMLYHVPSRVVVYGLNNAFTISFVGNLEFTFLFHIALTMFYGKFNSLYGAVLFHAMTDWAFTIFNNNTGDDPLWTVFLFNWLFALTMLVLGVRYLYKRRKERVLGKIRRG